MRPNENFSRLKRNYLFAEVENRAAKYVAETGKELLRLGIGDVTLPLSFTVSGAMARACEEMSKESTFRGYGPYKGYDFLRNAISGYYLTKKVCIDPEEIYVSDGAKSDLANFTDLLDRDSVILVQDPVYPVYVDAGTLAGNRIEFVEGNEGNGFLPLPPSKKCDVIYLCSPNNPTGAVYDYDMLAAWVDYAIENDALLLFDAAYEAYISDPTLPRSIYRIPRARECAIEFNSLSKTAGFTGLRCGYTVIPSTLTRGGKNLGELWLRRQSTKFNGVAYPVQRAAEAAFTRNGLAECLDQVTYYKQNATILTNAFKALGFEFTGGENSPYVWLKCPNGMKSWDFFDLLLNEAGIVGTPGAGFGNAGEGYFRLTAFGKQETATEAAKRLRFLFWK